MKPDLETLPAKLYYTVYVQHGGGSWFLDTRVTRERRAKLIGKHQLSPQSNSQNDTTLLILSGDRFIGGWGFQRWLAIATEEMIEHAKGAIPRGVRIAAREVQRNFKGKLPKSKEPLRFVFPKYELVAVAGKRLDWWRWDVDVDDVSIVKDKRFWTSA